jgi:hypothetical protein
MQIWVFTNEPTAWPQFSRIRMLSIATNLILNDLRSYIAAQDGGAGADAPEYVVAGNIALADVQDLTPSIRQRVVATVVNIAEEAALKNVPYYQRSGSTARYRNPPAFLNLYLLFSANYGDYDDALKRLSQVVTFFQGKNAFSMKDSLKEVPDQQILDQAEDMLLILDLFALTFEQVNYLWASLGGKQMPFVLYKVRLVRILGDRVQAETPVIEEIGAKESAV